MPEKDFIRETLYLKINNLKEDKGKIVKAAALIKEGRLVAFPTETVYGLGANALSPEAVKKIFQAKGRPADNPLIVHLPGWEELSAVVDVVPPHAWELSLRFWPGPLTLIFKAKRGVPQAVTGGLATVAVRVPGHPVALALLKEAGVPVAAPSANLSGRPSPTRAEHVLRDLVGRVDLILDGGPCQMGLESTVVNLVATPPVILRPGGVTGEELRKVIPDLVLSPGAKALTAATPPSPGMKYGHYAPKAPLHLLEGEEARVRKELLARAYAYRQEGLKVGLIVAAPLKTAGDFVLFNLGGSSDLAKAARDLFAVLRAMDDEGVDIILAEGFSETGLGAAVMDRLRRAAGTNISRF